MQKIRVVEGTDRLSFYAFRRGRSFHFTNINREFGVFLAESLGRLSPTRERCPISTRLFFFTYFTNRLPLPSRFIRGIIINYHLEVRVSLQKCLFVAR